MLTELFVRLSREDLLTAVDQIIRRDGVLKDVDAKTVDRCAQTLLWQTVFFIPKQNLFNNGAYLLGVVKRGKKGSHSLLFAPGSADKYAAHRYGFLGNCTEGALSDADAALRASLLVDDGFSVL